MSYHDGISAFNMEMPARVPRTEYSAHNHWDLVKTVTGIKVDQYSTSEEKSRARKEFIKKWNYDFIWRILIHNDVYNGLYTKMGHAAYAADGIDFLNDVNCPFTDPEQVLIFDPVEAYGQRDKKILISNFENHYKGLCELNNDTVNMSGIYITCISGLIEIFGWDMLLSAAGMDPEVLGKVTDRYAEWMQQYFDALAETDMPVVMVHDDIVWTSGAFFHPEWYRKYVFPNYKKYFAPLRESKKKIIYTSDGNYTEFIDDIVACGVNGFVMEPSTDMNYIAEKYGKTHSFVGNADTRILLNGSREDIKAEVKRCMDIGKKCPGFFMAVGNHIPSNTPVENALYYNEVYEKCSRR